MKNLLNNEGDTGLIPGQGGNPGGGSGNRLQYSHLGSPMDRGAWWPTVYGVTRVRHNLATKQQQKDQNCTVGDKKTSAIFKMMTDHSVFLSRPLPPPTKILQRGFPHSSVGKESACNARRPWFDSWVGRSAGEGKGYSSQYSWASLVAQLVKNLPAMWEI